MTVCSIALLKVCLALPVLSFVSSSWFAILPRSSTFVLLSLMNGRIVQGGPKKNEYEVPKVLFRIKCGIFLVHPVA